MLFKFNSQTIATHVHHRTVLINKNTMSYQAGMDHGGGLENSSEILINLHRGNMIYKTWMFLEPNTSDGNVMLVYTGL